MSPLKSEQALFNDVKELCESGWHEMPPTGTGAPGTYLEQILGGEIDNVDAPDAGRWEIKYTSGSSLLTLFHLTPEPPGCVKELIQNFGWTGSRNDRPSFRHTIHGISPRGFRIVKDGERICVQHDDMDGEPPHWTEDALLNSVGSKLRRLLLVRGTARKIDGKKHVRYEAATAFQQFRLTGLTDALVQGVMAVDFDAYLKVSGAVRDHGTKFRISVDDIGLMYNERTEIYP